MVDCFFFACMAFFLLPMNFPHWLSTVNVFRSSAVPIQCKHAFFFLLLLNGQSTNGKLKKWQFFFLSFREAYCLRQYSEAGWSSHRNAFVLLILRESKFKILNFCYTESRYFRNVVVSRAFAASLAFFIRCFVCICVLDAFSFVRYANVKRKEGKNTQLIEMVTTKGFFLSTLFSFYVLYISIGNGFE